MVAPPKALVDAIVASLRDHPEEWLITSGSAHHTSARTWVFADEPAFVSIQDDGAARSGRLPEFGGPSFWAWFLGLGWFVPWRRRLVMAIREASARKAAQKPAPVSIASRWI